mmetsp:Transcript_32647/g.70570  ORF Transcript_32647/g.70570 Transcript_32647/m.70570 type:complete len:147 (+) Transcript_32647:125-565(+)
MCSSCGHRWNEHNSVTDEEAAEIIIAENDGAAQQVVDGIWIGGFKSAMNEKFLKEHNIQAVLTAAKGLGDFFPLFGKKMTELFHSPESKFEDQDQLELELVDAGNQDLSTAIPLAMEFIAARRSEGKGVLVHCAQVVHCSEQIYLC